MENTPQEDPTQAKVSGTLRILGKVQTLDCVVIDGPSEFHALMDALYKFHSGDPIFLHEILSINDRRMPIPVGIVLEDVSVVVLLPPPSAVAIVTPSKGPGRITS